MRAIKSLAKDCLPPVIVRNLRRFNRDAFYFDGDYKTWSEALKNCTGYDSQLILEKVLKATLSVKRGDAAYERDSVLFHEVEYSWPVTAALMWSAAINGGSLRVLDFGGSLGSSFFQNRKFFTCLSNVNWSIVEQAHYVEVGRKYIADSVLNFYDSIEDCADNGSPNVILLSSVLQYLADPIHTIKLLSLLNADVLIIDRTPFIDGCNHKIKIQRTPSKIYSASYPIWFFNQASITSYIEGLGYKKIVDFESIDNISDMARWRGLIFRKST
jgi:putative methyltransferase (TIGR04325 family)